MVMHVRYMGETTLASGFMVGSVSGDATEDWRGGGARRGEPSHILSLILQFASHSTKLRNQQQQTSPP